MRPRGGEMYMLRHNMQKDPKGQIIERELGRETEDAYVGSSGFALESNMADKK